MPVGCHESNISGTGVKKTAHTVSTSKSQTRPPYSPVSAAYSQQTFSSAIPPERRISTQRSRLESNYPAPSFTTSGVLDNATWVLKQAYRAGQIQERSRQRWERFVQHGNVTSHRPYNTRAVTNEQGNSTFYDRLKMWGRRAAMGFRRNSELDYSPAETFQTTPPTTHHSITQSHCPCIYELYTCCYHCAQCTLSFGRCCTIVGGLCSYGSRLRGWLCSGSW